MSAMNIMGTYSGIDMSTIDQLIQAESARGTKFATQKNEYQTQQTAWKDVNSRLDSFYKKLDALKSKDTFNAKSVNVSSKDFVSVTADSSASTGTYKIQVSQLASATRLTGGKIPVESLKDELGISGNLILNNGESEDPFEFNVTSEMSLKDVKDMINDQSDKSKIKANIVDNRLILERTDTGEKTLTLEGSAVSDLKLNENAVVDGKAAIFTVDGIEIQKDSNTISDVLEGVTFNLQNVHAADKSDTLRITDNTGTAADALKEVIDQYNSLNSFIDTQLSVGDPSAENNKTGALVGDSSLMRLQTNLRSLLTRNMETASESVNSLQDLGVEIDRDGLATFDRTKFVETFENDPKGVSLFFHSSENEEIPSVDENGDPTTETVTKLTGFANVTRSLVNEYISSTTGIIKTKSDTYDRLIKDVNKRIETFNTRIETKRQQYIKQFTALDTAMMQAESQLQFMMGQLGGTEKG
ncbi:flagellar filament capping protein FliD [Marinilactibacillus psychrotolerans]|uniref:Flagellar hook-associated protein 2 n=1 Tax=Marinilactibacillus psychrotolerans TaxID=191770 RepID=A0AAV3WSX2_9LACT|nr:flagellar filament capping protein FliD [Marinilactibacillus psychrotolerans]GEL66200.1 flagellar hook-associated protein 2 [Marinilactibacillus psychrotolerans]GEQ35057.1 flagellum hook associated protein FliD [Marinilactibacillus psychrotolerans]SDC27663.1 flagellar hook-associated protein 2 [Marinilactibacillus psychrotolerans]